MNQYFLIPTDANNDGKTDIIRAKTVTYNSTATGTIYLDLYVNNGVTATYQPTFALSASKTQVTNVRHYPIPIFLNPTRPNFDLEYGFISDNTISLFQFQKNLKRESELASVSQDGVQHAISYRRLMADNDYVLDIPLYTSSYEQTFPYIDIHNAPGLGVVNKVTRSFGAQTVQQVFGYAKAVSNADGMGFVGFGELVRSDWHVNYADTNRTFSIGIQDPQLRGANLRSFTSKNSFISAAIKNTALGYPPPVTGVADGATLWDYMGRSDNAYQTDTLPNRVFVNVPVATAGKDLLSGTFGTQTMAYDSLYNVTHTVANSNGEATQTVDASYANSLGTPYYVGRPISSSTTVQTATDTTSSSVEYSYTGYLPTQVKRQGNGTGWVTENLVYDGFGNVTQRSTTAPDSAQRTESMAYDATGRFMTQHTDADSLVTSYTHYPTTGNVETHTNPYGHIESYGYNTWGWQTFMEDYLGNFHSRTYARVSTSMQITDTNQESSESITIINALGQTTETREKTVLGSIIRKIWEYDVYGRQTGERLAKIGTVNLDSWNRMAYDRYGRVRQTTAYTGQVSNYSYDTLSTTVNDGTKTVTTTKNALDQVVSLQDPGGTVSYTYFANGNLRTADYGGSVQTLEQDGWGRKTKLTDPSAGVYEYAYDGWGQLTEETTPKGVTTYSYDGAGKLLLKTITGDSTDMQQSYSYDAVTKLPTASSLINGDGNNTSYGYTYDGYQRPDSLTEDNPHARFVKSYTYDGYGRIYLEATAAKDKASNIAVQQTVVHQYQNGELLRLTLQDSGQLLWEVENLNEFGQLSASLQGSNLRNTYIYDEYALLERENFRKIAPSAQLLGLETTFNRQRGLLMWREDGYFDWYESFAYDNLNRLTTFNDNDGNKSQTYDAHGRITGNSQLGSYGYDSTSYQLAELDLNPTADTYYQTHALQELSYNAFKSPVEIWEQGHERISFQYNGALGRSHMYYGGEQTDPLQRRYRRHYAQNGGTEITRDTQTGKVSFVFYLGGDAYTAPAIWKQEYMGGDSTQALYYLHRNYLGSIVLITDTAGDAVERRLFDAWGQLVKLTDGNGNDLPAFVILDRGYTGHEHLLGVGLIHMNARLYDPRLHRMLAPDNFVQDPYGTQNFNRYGYVLNNPLVYVDENGEFLLFALIFGGINVAVQASNGEIENFWDAAKAFGAGALTGTLGQGLGKVFIVPFTAVAFKASVLHGLFTNDWDRLHNAARLFAGNFYLDGNRDFLGQLWQGMGRFNWEYPQTTLGYAYSQFRNATGSVTRVDYFGGATFATNENSRNRDGISLGNFINVNIRDRIAGNFVDHVISDPLYMHEYGHTFDSRIFGLSYLLAVGAPSAYSAWRSSAVPGEPTGVNTHSFRWYEMRANRHAARYFARYGVDWDRLYREGTYETYYPRWRR